MKINKTDKLVFDLHMPPLNYDKARVDALRKEAAEKYGVPVRNVSVNFIPEVTNGNGDRMSLTSDVIKNIQDPQFQLGLFREYLAVNHVDGIDFADIEDIDAQVNNFVDFDVYDSYKSYRFKYVKWDNYLSYGKGNFFDFTKLKGLVLLNGMPENQCGKTTFAIDLLRFALFGKAEKSPDLNSVFNIYRPEDTEVMVEACIEIDGVDYIIRRTVSRPAKSRRTPKSKAKQKVEYFRIVNSHYEEIVNCVGGSGVETNNIIRESVGTIEDYNLIISATAKTLGDLLDMGQADKGRLFSRWLGLLTVEKKEEVAKDLWKKNVSPKLLSNSVDAATLNEEVADYNAIIASDRTSLEEEEKKLKACKERLSALDKRRNDALNEKKAVKEVLTNIDITTIEAGMETQRTQLTQKRAEMAAFKEDYANVKDANFDPAELERLTQKIEADRNTVHSLDLENTELKTCIRMHKDEIARIRALIDAKRCPTCGQVISESEQVMHIDKHNKEVNSLINKGVANKNEAERINGVIAADKAKVEQLLAEQKRLTQKNSLELKMIALKNNIDNIKLTIAELVRQRNDVEENKENVRINNELNNRIKVIDETIKTEDNIKDNVIHNIEALKQEMANCQKEIDKRKVMLEKLTQEQKVIRTWSLYQQMVGKNGIIKMVLRKALPVINNEIARLLNGLCDFKVEVSVSEDNKVCLDMVRAGQRLDLGVSASGFETVMASIALRHSLACIATLPKPNFTVMDEVLDGVAVSNYENVHELFKRMCNAYDFVIHITHNELLSDWHDMNVLVTKNEDMVSSIALR